MYVIILNRFFWGIWAFLEAKTEKEYGYPIFHLFHFGDQQIDIFYVAKLNTKKWWCAGGEGGGGVGGAGRLPAGASHVLQLGFRCQVILH